MLNLNHAPHSLIRTVYACYAVYIVVVGGDGAAAAAAVTSAASFVMC